jgi:hypothetical protein
MVKKDGSKILVNVKMTPERFVCEIRPSGADDNDVLAKPFLVPKCGEGGNQFSLCKVTGTTENDNCRICDALGNSARHL